MDPGLQIWNFMKRNIETWAYLVGKGQRTNRMIIWQAIISVIVLLVVVAAGDTSACTIWAAAGDGVKGGGALIAKNRDNSPDLRSVFKTVSPDSGFRFFGVFDIEADGYVVGGINEKGFVAVNASANSVPKKKRHVATEDFTERLLMEFSSVNEALDQAKLFMKTHPALYIIADSTKIASIEVAPGGSTAFHVTDNGTLALTNHYVDEGLTWANEIENSNSTARLERIADFLDDNTIPFTFEGFIEMADDRTGGPHDSIWRSGSEPAGVRTLASLVFHLPSKGDPVMFLKTANPDEPWKEYTVTVNKLFWDRTDIP